MQDHDVWPDPSCPGSRLASMHEFYNTVIDRALRRLLATWRPSFSLRTLVIVVPIVIGIGAWQVAPSLQEANKIAKFNESSSASIAAIEKAGGRVEVTTFTRSLGWYGSVRQILIVGVSFSPQRSQTTESLEVCQFPRSDRLFAALRAIATSFNLDVSHTDFCNSDLEQLEGAGFVSLNANGTKLSGNEIHGDCPKHLFFVSVRKTAAGDSFVRWMSTHSNIRWADLSDTQISDQALESLLQNTYLRWLDVKNTRLSKDAIEMLEEQESMKKLRHSSEQSMPSGVDPSTECH